MAYGCASLPMQIPNNVLLALPQADEGLTQLIVNALTNLTQASSAAMAFPYSRFTYPYDSELSWLSHTNNTLRIHAAGMFF